MSRPISKAKGRLTSQVTTSSTTISFQATDSNRALTSVTMSDFGTYGYLVINPSGKIGNYAIVRFESWSVSGSVITVGTLQWETFQGNDGAGTLVEFPAGTTCVIGNSHHLFNNVVRTEDAQTIAGVKTFSSSPVVPTPSGNTDAANKAYVDGVSVAGASDANTTTKGIVEQATNAETKAGTATGGTAAKLFATPADIADAIQSGSWVYAADSVGTDAYAIAPTPAISAYAAGQKFLVKVATANTGAATLAVSGLTAKAIKKFHDQTLEDGDIEANSIIELAYDAVADTFQLLTPVATTPTTAIQAEMSAFFGATDITGAEAETLSSGVTSDATALHTHPLQNLFLQTLGTDRKLLYILDTNERGNPGYTETLGGTGSVAEDVVNTQFASGATSGSLAQISTTRMASNGVFISGSSSTQWTLNTTLIYQMALTQITAQDFFGGIGNPTIIGVNGTDVTKHIGFFVEDGTIWASNADGTTQTRTDVSSGITLTRPNTFHFDFTSGTNIKFYINGTLVATHTTNLPGTDSTNFEIAFGFSNSAASNKSMEIYRRVLMLIKQV